MIPVARCFDGDSSKRVKTEDSEVLVQFGAYKKSVSGGLATLLPSPTVKLLGSGLSYDGYEALCVLRSLRNRRHCLAPMQHVVTLLFLMRDLVRFRD